ncbi:hypothetical protein [Telmatospirillum sp.]|uniref:hypothetical protein n=1 Tax=Telmatospirillum sp. TaxID=2079197 RepID=UPI00284F616F|nr:hypothetical protein [Telmatospirillum sp.]MDR3439101.1 hypothetical protein [Telmatospirillum sp.]
MSCDISVRETIGLSVARYAYSAVVAVGRSDASCGGEGGYWRSQTEVFVSQASAREIAIKQVIGRIDFPVAEMPAIIDAAGFTATLASAPG